jgi:hypothetical protein
VRRLAALGLLLMACVGAQAQAIYRCGTEYSQTPCPGGKVLESSDPRSAAQRTEALRVAAQERRRVAELERERRALEKGTKPAKPTGFNGRPATPDDAVSAERSKSGKAASRAKATNGNDFVAVEPRKPKEAKPK